MNKTSTNDAKPDRDNLGPTDPAKMPPKEEASYEEKHPHPGNITPKGDPNVGPMPTDDPRHKAVKPGEEIEKR